MPEIDLGRVNGFTFTPSVNDSGTLSWSNDGGLPNPPSVNVKGPQGEQGPKGDKGDDGADISAADLQRIADNESDIADLKAENALLRELISGIDAPIYRTTSGNPATFSDGYANAALKLCVVTLTPAQSGSGDPSPDNVRAILSYSSVTVTRTDADGAESPNLQTVTVTFADGTDPLTVYGAALDVISGVLTVTHKLWTLKDMTWATYGGAFYTNFAGRATTDSIDGYGAVSNVLKRGKIISSGSATMDDYSFNLFNAANNYPYRIYCKVPDIETIEAFVAWCETNAAVIVTPLETPVSYNLTPVSLTSLSGYNSVSADAGTLSVTYRADTSISLA